MTDSEFIAGIASGEYGKNEVLRYLDECPDKAYFKDEVLVAHTQALCTSNDIPIIPSGGNGDIHCEKSNLPTLEQRRLFDALQWLDEAIIQPTQPQPREEQGEPLLPTEIRTDSVKTYFQRAINKGYMERRGNGYKWLKSNVRLGYLCYKVFQSPRPINILEHLFAVNKLSASISQAENHSKNSSPRADVKKWLDEMNSDLFTE